MEKTDAQLLQTEVETQMGALMLELLKKNIVIQKLEALLAGAKAAPEVQ